MKKTLIIASCGLIVALIISATAQDKPSGDEKNAEQYFQIKCTEPVDDKAEQTPCAMRAHEDAHADMFLRELKRKLRRAYA